MTASRGERGAGSLAASTTCPELSTLTEIHYGFTLRHNLRWSQLENIYHERCSIGPLPIALRGRRSDFQKWIHTHWAVVRQGGDPIFKIYVYIEQYKHTQTEEGVEFLCSTVLYWSVGRLLPQSTYCDLRPSLSLTSPRPLHTTVWDTRAPEESLRCDCSAAPQHPSQGPYPFLPSRRRIQPRALTTVDY